MVKIVRSEQRANNFGYHKRAGAARCGCCFVYKDTIYANIFFLNLQYYKKKLRKFQMKFSELSFRKDIKYAETQNLNVGKAVAVNKGINFLLLLAQRTFVCRGVEISV